MSFILAAGEQIKKYKRPGQLVILESTTYPGTTDEVLQPMLEEGGAELDKDFLLAFSPERVDPGNPQFQTHNIPKVVGGVSKDSTEAAAMLYGQIVERGASRFVGPRRRGVQAVGKHLSRDQYRHGERNGQALQRPRHRHLGGRPCGGDQAVRLYAVLSRAGHRRSLHPARPALFVVEGTSAWLRFAIHLACRDRSIRRCRTMLPDSFATRSTNSEKSVNGSKILILGVAYKKDIDDMRESPALSVIDLLRARGADVDVSRPVTSTRSRLTTPTRSATASRFITRN